jgi:DNA modification methylase
MAAGRIIHADVLDGLASLPAGWFHLVVTSPPYWFLRLYAGVAATKWSDGMECCLGMEPTPDDFVRHLVQVFEAVKRVLREDGVLFVNLGETYFGDSPTRVSSAEAFSETWDKSQTRSRGGRRRSAAAINSLKPGDRCGIPERFALAMQTAGWCWRDTVIWAKRSPMPSSQSGWRWMKCRVKVGTCPVARRGLNGNQQAEITEANNAKWQDCPGCPKCLPHGGYVLRRGRFRTTAAHEPIFMFTRGKHYFCDDQAASEPAVGGTPGNKSHKAGDAYTAGEHHDHLTVGLKNMVAVERRLPRSVWHLSSEPSREKHFASYPTAIPRRCIEMATSSAGCCPACGACLAPVVESLRVPTRPGVETKCYADNPGAIDQGSPYRDHSEIGNRDPQRHIATTRVLGYRPTCGCSAGEPVPCRVLDPFAGTGTTLQVANALGRDWCGIEASADYLEICERRARTPLPVKKDGKAKPKKVKPMRSQKELFV